MDHLHVWCNNTSFPCFSPFCFRSPSCVCVFYPFCASWEWFPTTMLNKTSNTSTQPAEVQSYIKPKVRSDASRNRVTRVLGKDQVEYLKHGVCTENYYLHYLVSHIKQMPPPFKRQCTTYIHRIKKITPKLTWQVTFNFTWNRLKIHC